MAPIYRFRAILENWPGGPGVTTWHYLPFDLGAIDVDGTVTGILSCYEQFLNYIVAGIRISVDPAIEVLDDKNGHLVEVATHSIQSEVFGTGPITTVSRATMVVASLSTPGIVQGGNPLRSPRRLKGRHFHGPVSAGSMASSGSITTVAKDTIEAAYSLSVQAGGMNLAVWHRPTADGADDGVAFPVTGVRVLDKPGVLRSRRD